MPMFPAVIPGRETLKGRRLGPYVPERLLGRGGMGEVWKSWDSDLDRWVGLKLPHLHHPQTWKRLEREAAATARLSHPHLLQIYSIGQADGRPYIAMQYVEGCSLAEVSRDDRKRAVRYVRDATLAVALAHANGLIHRDLKPTNLLIERARDHAFVCDFGLAHDMRGMESSRKWAGTPAFMAPELVRGERGDARSDLYSLGVCLYFLLAGAPPFAADSTADLLQYVVHRPPPSLRGVDADLDAVVAKCLEKAPDRRYAGAAELADDLTRWLSGEKPSVRPVSRFRRWWSGWTRRK